MRLLSLVIALLSLFPSTTPPAGSYDDLNRRAEVMAAEGSYRLAHELYERASQLELSPADRRWIELRLADTAWRALGADHRSDPTELEKAQAALEELIRKTGDDHDRVWAEAQESLGDLLYERNPSTANSHYVAALDWWAGSETLDLARQHYLGIIWKMTATSYGAYASSNAPREVLVNAVAIASTAEERDHARYLLADQLLMDRTPQSAERAGELLEAIIRDGKASEWYDDALYRLGLELATQGAVVVNDDGNPVFKPDYPKALTLFRRIITEFKPGETRYLDDAKRQIESIVEPAVNVFVSSTFLPSSEQELYLSWRNVKDVALSITAVDLTQDYPVDTHGNWIESIPTAGQPVVRSWSYATNDTGEHQPGNDRVRLAPKLEPGAYIVKATAQGRSARALLLVTDANVMVHALGGKLHVYVSDVMTGEPIAGARVRVWKQVNSKPAYVTFTAETNAQGLAKLDTGSGYSTIITASKGMGRQAWESTYTYENREPGESWKIYAFADRPAYRPDEAVHWKIIARWSKNDRLAVPTQPLHYRILNPRNEQVTEGEAKLNAFGSFWSDLPLTSSMPLGEYTIQFSVKGDSDYVGAAQLFRLEEYKLPEFKVSVSTPEENGKRKQYRLGDTVEATIEASYYFGGAVANANVEAVVYQQPYFRAWYPWREYDWYFQEPENNYEYGGTQIQRETLKTDADGKAVIRFETPRDGQPSSYRIEARVIDSSRREISGSGTVRVLQHRYSVIAHPQHFIVKPGEKASIDFSAADANEQPIETTGNVKVVRRVWEEIWLDPEGHEVSGRALERARFESGVFPLPGWRQKVARYRDEDVVSGKVKTDAKGEATFGFTPSRDGYYTATWTSEDRDPGKPVRARDLVSAETGVWVSHSSTTELGYNASGLQIIVDKEAFRSGQTAPVMIVTPSSGRWVVLSTSFRESMESQVLHLDGTVKLLQIPIDDRHVPSFRLTASSIQDRTLLTSAQRVVVPPVEHFLNVDVKPDRETYEPRQEGSVTITTRDVDGKPVPAEVALSVADESVTAIAQDPAGDPRQTFYGEDPEAQVTVTGSAQSQRYVRMVVGKDGKLIDERDLERDERRAKNERFLDNAVQEMGVEGGVVGGVVGGVAGGWMSGPPPPPPPMAPRPVSEAITVAAAAPVFAKKVDAISRSGVKGDRDQETPRVEVVVRTDFRSTAFWKPDVVTGPDGTAKVTVKYPESLTTWRAAARAVGPASQFGMASATARTNMPLIVRLEAPRFFVAGDRARVSAVINNNTDQPMRVAPTLDAGGLAVRSEALAPIDVPPNGEARADWVVAAERAGAAKLRVTGKSPSHADSMERTFVVYEHGIDKLLARSGKLRGDEAIVKLDLPAERRATAMTVQVAPSLAVTMLDALPYLVDYPYGCTEQTMSRFLPAAIVARTLVANGLDADDIEGHLFGGIEQEHAPQTHREGKRDLHRLDAIASQSMKRLYDFQHSDGGWGWWKDGSSDVFMTAYVVWGFSVAKEGGLDVDAGAVQRAAAWLEQELPKLENDGHDEAWVLHALSAWRSATHSLERSLAFDRAFNDAYSHRDKLSSFSRALLAITAHQRGDHERAQVLVRNLEDGARIDRAPDTSVLLRGSTTTAETMATAHWGEDRFWWHWWEGPVESTSFVLEALVAIDPHNPLVESSMNWLVKNRRGAQWNNTRDTAISLLALNDYLKASGELAGDVSYEVSANGTVVASKTITAADVLRAPSRFAIPESSVRDGANEIRIRRTGGRGGAALYFSAEARFVSLEEPVTAAGNEIFVRRDYFRLAPRPTLLKGVVYDRQPLLDRGSLDSSDRVEVVVTIETKNDYDYLLLEDLKPAGLEAVQLQSGTPLYASELRSSAVTRKFVAAPRPPGEKPAVIQRDRFTEQTGRTAWVYQELRDRKVAMFIDHLPQGVWEIRYSLRAEVPGSFHALPLMAQAMYVPEIRANSDEVRMEVAEKK